MLAKRSEKATNALILQVWEVTKGMYLGKFKQVKHKNKNVLLVNFLTHWIPSTLFCMEYNKN